MNAIAASGFGIAIGSLIFTHPMAAIGLAIAAIGLAYADEWDAAVRERVAAGGKGWTPK